MAKQKPSIPKGTRDFSPEESVKRNYIFSSLRNTFERSGYKPIETPSMESLDTLMGKYGEEGDKLIFKILNSGNFLSKVNEEITNNSDTKKLGTKICEKALRYDLTVPFARYVVQHQNDICLPFKRYQIQAVWRADKPQKGRYREFYQCDIDVIGSDSLLNEFELISVIDDVFSTFSIPVTIKINNRKILSGIAETIGESDRLIDITVAIDKLEKIGIEKVIEELAERGIPKNAIDKLLPILNLNGDTYEKLSQLEEILSESTVGMKGIEEIKTIFSYISKFPIESTITLDLSLARGLNYYTGAIIEVIANDHPIGSICGGGRYDDLTGIFGMPDVSGVGISFGAERIYDIMNNDNLFPDIKTAFTKVLFLNLGEKEENFCIGMATKLRKAGVNTEIYPKSVKMKKQMTYANRNQIPYVIIIGEDEMNKGMLTVKNMESGEQNLLNFEEIVDYIK